MTTKPIAHEEAIKRKAVELYLMNELSEEEQLSFEAHYFECRTCADAVAAGQALIANVRPVLRSRAPIWRQPVAAIAAMLVAVAGVQQLVIASLMAPHANTVILARERAKGLENSAYSVKTASATVELNLPSEAEFPFYLMKIGCNRKSGFSRIVPAPPKDSEQRLSLQVPPKALGRGHCAVQIEGVNSEKANSGLKVDEVYEFDLK